MTPTPPVLVYLRVAMVIFYIWKLTTASQLVPLTSSSCLFGPVFCRKAASSDKNPKTAQVVLGDAPVPFLSISIVLVSFLYLPGPYKSNLRNEKSILVSSLRVWCIVSGKTWRQERAWTGGTHPQSGDANAGAQLVAWCCPQ